MIFSWLRFKSIQRKQRRLREIEAEYRDARSDRLLADLQNRRTVAEKALRDRQRGGQWETLAHLIQSGRV